MALFHVVINFCTHWSYSWHLAKFENWVTRVKAGLWQFENGINFEFQGTHSPETTYFVRWRVSSTDISAYLCVLVVLHFCFWCLLLFVVRASWQKFHFVFTCNTLLLVWQLEVSSAPERTSKLVGFTYEAKFCTFYHFPKHGSFITWDHVLWGHPVTDDMLMVPDNKKLCV